MKDDRTLIGALEAGQLTAATEVMLPRRKLGRGSVILLIALRLYVLIAIPLVCYAFVRALLRS